MNRPCWLTRCALAIAALGCTLLFGAAGAPASADYTISVDVTPNISADGTAAATIDAYV